MIHHYIYLRSKWLDVPGCYPCPSIPSIMCGGDLTVLGTRYYRGIDRNYVFLSDVVQRNQGL